MSLPGPADLFDRVMAAAAAARAALGNEPVEVAVVFGSGLSVIADAPAGLADTRAVPYARLPGFPGTTVAGHPGRLVAGTLDGRRVLMLCGRVHGYEGHDAAEIGFGVRVAAALGARTLVVTNAAGGIDPAMRPGEIVCIKDHLNLTGTSPLRGPNDDRLGPRFVDMTDAYAPELRWLAANIAPSVLGYALRAAIYAGVNGPAYETPAEVHMLEELGAGLVGMSTVHEVLAARHAGLAVLGLSVVSNPAAGVVAQRLRHEDVTTTANAAAQELGAFLFEIIRQLPAPAADSSSGAGTPSP